MRFCLQVKDAQMNEFLKAPSSASGDGSKLTAGGSGAAQPATLGAGAEVLELNNLSSD